MSMLIGMGIFNYSFCPHIFSSSPRICKLDLSSNKNKNEILIISKKTRNGKKKKKQKCDVFS